MFAVSSCRHEIPLLALKLFSMAAVGQGGRHDHETTVDHDHWRTWNPVVPETVVFGTEIAANLFNGLPVSEVRSTVAARRAQGGEVRKGVRRPGRERHGHHSSRPQSRHEDAQAG